APISCCQEFVLRDAASAAALRAAPCSPTLALEGTPMSNRPSGALDFDALRPPSPFMNDTHRAWRENLRKFVERELMPHVSDWDEAGHVPREVFLKAGKFGLLGAGYPEKYGGWSDGFDRFHGIVTSEELARLGAGGVTAALMVHGIGLPPILAIGSE